MVNPTSVISPQDKWKLVDVLMQGGGPNCDDWALSVGYWTDEGTHTSPCLALRWNGGPGPEKGNPVSRGYPTWFIVPEEFYDAMMACATMSGVPEVKLASARAVLKLDDPAGKQHAPTPPGWADALAESEAELAEGKTIPLALVLAELRASVARLEAQQDVRGQRSSAA